MLGDPSEAARDADALALLKWAFASYRLVAPVERGQVEARPRVRFKPDERIDAIAARAVRVPLPRDEAVRVMVKVPDELGGPLAAPRSRGDADGPRGGRTIARVALLTARPVPRVGLLERLARAIARPGSLVAIVAMLGGAAVLVARRAAGAGARRRPRGHGGRMIITVTLNTAIDKTLEVPNFRLGRRHRSVAQTTMPGGKGVNVARALKRLGRPVIATGLAGGADRHAHRRAAHASESILNDFVRIREESRTNTAVIDPTTGEQTEINERGPAVSAQEIELFPDKLLYLARARRCACSPGRCRARSTPTCTRG